MPVYATIVASVILGDIAWWLWADRRLCRLRRARLWRTLLGIFSGFQLGYVLWHATFNTAGRHAHAWMPAGILASVYLWHLLILPITLLVIIATQGFAVLARRVRRAASDASPAADGPSRRQVLASAMVAIPPLLTIGAVGRAMGQIHNLRINRVELALRGLPPDLDGITIAQVSDIHIGRFTRPNVLPAIADMTNSLRADLILLTGDLIDLTLADLPAGIDFVRRLDPRGGLFLCEGNHDLIEDPEEFESRVRQAGLPLLLDETTVVPLRGRPVQIMGMIWARRKEAIAEATARLVQQRRPDAFPILMAHHPHAFDAAAEAGLPLVLSGHTHGGQLMLNERLGAGPVLFRYWSGLYRKNDSALFVSNGVGNWFPLRIGAPAEIVHLTLRSA